jgi:hypothetical protein
MSRRNLGSKLKFLEKRGLYYIVWTEDGRSRERSTGTADSTAAQIELAQFLQRRTSGVRTREPSEFLVTDALTAYLEHLEAIGKDCERAAYASVPLTDYFAGKSTAEVPSLCVGFQRWRKASNGTVRRDLGVLQSAMKHALEAQIVTRHVVIKLPAAPPPRERWLTRRETCHTSSISSCAVHSSGPLHWTAEGGDPISQMVEGRSCARQNRLQEGWHCGDKEEKRSLCAA